MPTRRQSARPAGSPPWKGWHRARRATPCRQRTDVSSTPGSGKERRTCPSQQTHTALHPLCGNPQHQQRPSRHALTLCTSAEIDVTPMSSKSNCGMLYPARHVAVVNIKKGPPSFLDMLTVEFEETHQVCGAKGARIRPNMRPHASESPPKRQTQPSPQSDRSRHEDRPAHSPRSAADAPPSEGGGTEAPHLALPTQMVLSETNLLSLSTSHRMSERSGT